MQSERGPPGPWIYTGGLENWAGLVAEIGSQRPLWGNGPAALRWSRDPFRLQHPLKKAGLPVPRLKLWRRPARNDTTRWLVKRTCSTGGAGIQFYSGSVPEDISEDKWYYFQEYIEGMPCAALFVRSGNGATFLGLTRQLVGESWLHARQFQYCGSLGPLPVSPDLHEHFARLATVLAKGSRWATLDAAMVTRFSQALAVFREGSGLRGLFGVDCILRDGIPWPIEINPRYTASVEVLEYGGGVPAMALHRAVFDPTAPVPDVRPRSTGIVGKAILFAKDSLDFPIDGPWMPTLRSPGPIEEMPEFADIPHAGERIEARHPILTFFARAESEASCLEQLKSIAADLDRWLFKA